MDSKNINISPTKTTNFIAYPLQFTPILKDRIWGGKKLAVLGKQLPSDTIGESWEIAMVGDDLSYISNGVYANLDIEKLITAFPEEILGTKIYETYGKQFPLLFKFLDAKTDLSIQLHPNDALAKKRHNTFGKTEMWYIMQADEGARIILGFKENSSAEEYLLHLDHKTLPTILKEYRVKTGDVFFIETGTIHAIGGGIVLAEIQQTSDITYRVYDWDRVDESGNQRELHVDMALEAINYKVKQTKIDYSKNTNEANLLVKSPFFVTNYIPLQGTKEIITDGTCFRVYICTSGTCDIIADGLVYTLKMGETVLMPAIIREFDLKGNAEILEVYI